jgi:hypothetical protein
MFAQVMKSPGRVFMEFGFLSFYRDAFRTLVLRKSPDEVARINGWSFHTNGVHLNSRGGLIVADPVQKFLRDERNGPNDRGNSDPANSRITGNP